MISIKEGSRIIVVPNTDKVFGTTIDSNVERKYFEVFRYTTNNVDLSTCTIQVNWNNANNETGVSYPLDVVADGDVIHFSWVIPYQLVKYEGNISFNIEASKLENDERAVKFGSANAGAKSIPTVEYSESEEEKAEINSAVTEGVALIQKKSNDEVEAIGHFTDEKKTEINALATQKHNEIDNFTDERINDMSEVFNSMFDELVNDGNEQIAKVESKGTEVLNDIDAKKTTVLSDIGAEVGKAQAFAQNAKSSELNAKESEANAKRYAEGAESIANTKADKSELENVESRLSESIQDTNRRVDATLYVDDEGYICLKEI